MAGIPPQHPLQIVIAVAGAGHAAPRRVGKRGNTVDVGILRQEVGIEGVGDVARYGGGAVDRGEHRQIVARADTAVGPPVAAETRPLRVIEERRGTGLRAHRGIALEGPHLDIVDVDVGAGRYGLGSKADDLTVFADRLAGRDVRQRHLVARRDGMARSQALAEACAGRQCKPGDRHVVVGLQADNRGHVPRCSFIGGPEPGQAKA
jgi:hypothetical protein